jgi:hypothetical protein
LRQRAVAATAGVVPPLEAFWGHVFQDRNREDRPPLNLGEADPYGFNAKSILCGYFGRMPYERSKESGHRRIETLISFLIFVLILTAAFFALAGIIARW